MLNPSPYRAYPRPPLKSGPIVAVAIHGLSEAGDHSLNPWPAITMTQFVEKIRMGAWGDEFAILAAQLRVLLGGRVRMPPISPVDI